MLQWTDLCTKALLQNVAYVSCGIFCTQRLPSRAWFESEPQPRLNFETYSSANCAPSVRLSQFLWLNNDIKIQPSPVYEVHAALVFQSGFGNFKLFARPPPPPTAHRAPRSERSTGTQRRCQHSLARRQERGDYTLSEMTSGRGLRRL